MKILYSLLVTNKINLQIMLKILSILTKVQRKFNIKCMINLKKMIKKDYIFIDIGFQKKIYRLELKYS